jgi:hypothetical protein
MKVDINTLTVDGVCTMIRCDLIDSLYHFSISHSLPTGFCCRVQVNIALKESVFLKLLYILQLTSRPRRRMKKWMCAVTHLLFQD